MSKSALKSTPGAASRLRSLWGAVLLATLILLGWRSVQASFLLNGANLALFNVLNETHGTSLYLPLDDSALQLDRVPLGSVLETLGKHVSEIENPASTVAQWNSILLRFQELSGRGHRSTSLKRGLGLIHYGQGDFLAAFDTWSKSPPQSELIRGLESAALSRLGRWSEAVEKQPVRHFHGPSLNFRIRLNVLLRGILGAYAAIRESRWGVAQEVIHESRVLLLSNLNRHEALLDALEALVATGNKDSKRARHLFRLAHFRWPGILAAPEFNHEYLATLPIELQDTVLPRATSQVERVEILQFVDDFFLHSLEFSPNRMAAGLPMRLKLFWSTRNRTPKDCRPVPKAEVCLQTVSRVNLSPLPDFRLDSDSLQELSELWKPRWAISAPKLSHRAITVEVDPEASFQLFRSPLVNIVPEKSYLLLAWYRNSRGHANFGLAWQQNQTQKLVYEYALHGGTSRDWKLEARIFRSPQNCSGAHTVLVAGGARNSAEFRQILLVRL